MSNKERLFPIGILEKSKSNELRPNFEKGEFYLADYLNKKLPREWNIYTRPELKARWGSNQNKNKLFLNKGNFNFSFHPLAAEAQLSPVYAIAADDFDRDGDMDLVLGGNQYRAKPEVGIYDASYGAYLEQTDSLRFRSSKQQKGLSVKGEIRDLKISPQGLLVIRNNDSIVAVKY